MERGGGRAFFFSAGDFFFLLARFEVREDEGRCQEAAACCSSPGAEAPWLRPASDRELETPELTPEVEWCDWWPDTLEMQENPDWVDCREVMEPL